MKKLSEDAYIVFDLETTGLSAREGDSIIEIGAVKLENGEITDKFDELIDPGKTLDPKISEITNITDDMLKGKPSEKEMVMKFMNWCGNLPLVAHNARFDLSFLEMAHLKYNLGKLKNTIIDTLGLSRYLESHERYHNLATLVKRYDIEWDEDKHHRADYDSEGTALIFYKMLKKLELNEITSLADLIKYRAIVIKYNKLKEE